MNLISIDSYEILCYYIECDTALTLKSLYFQMSSKTSDTQFAGYVRAMTALMADAEGFQTCDTRAIEKIVSVALACKYMYCLLVRFETMS